MLIRRDSCVGDTKLQSNRVCSLTLSTRERHGSLFLSLSQTLRSPRSAGGSWAKPGSPRVRRAPGSGTSSAGSPVLACGSKRSAATLPFHASLGAGAAASVLGNPKLCARISCFCGTSDTISFVLQILLGRFAINFFVAPSCRPPPLPSTPLSVPPPPSLFSIALNKTV